MARRERNPRGVYEYVKYSVEDFLIVPAVAKVNTGVWYIRYRDRDGKLHRERVGPKGKAIELYGKRRNEIVEGKFRPDAVRARRAVSFKEIAEDFITWGKANKKSWADDVQRLGYWIEHLGTKPAGSVTAQEIETWKTKLTEVRKLKNRKTQACMGTTINRYLASLRSAYYLAMKNGKAEKNPVKGVKFYPERQNRRVRYLSDEEEKRVFAVLKDDERPFVVLALHTGIRLSGLKELLWGDVDFSAGVIDVQEAKGGRNYQVPMNRVVRETLRRMRDERMGALQPTEKGNVAALPSSILQKHAVFPRWQGRRKWIVSKWFEDVIDKTGIEDFTFHCLRHSFASRLVMAGVDLTTVKELMGHRTIEMTLRYAHLSPSHKQSAVERLAGGGSVERSITPSINGTLSTDLAGAKVAS
ncbi:MAG: site-specific integrase [Nitrospirae bacterium]|nr:site-specific integrase [Nitrospirota bacterium]